MTAEIQEPSGREDGAPLSGSGVNLPGEEKFHPLHVQLPVYDGPLDLLLDLIKKNEMDIYDIPIAEITRKYLDHLALMKELNLDIAGEFLVMAATLIYIKSRMLLPVEAEEDEDEGADPRAELVRKLLEYHAIREAAKELGMLEAERGKVFCRQISDYYLAGLSGEDVHIDTFSADLYDLLAAFQKVTLRAGRDLSHEIFEEIISIEQKITEIRLLLRERRRLMFSALFGEKFSRNELIATFLALLEIIRSRAARVIQEKQFGDILIEACPDQESLTAGDLR